MKIISLSKVLVFLVATTSAFTPVRVPMSALFIPRTSVASVNCDVECFVPDFDDTSILPESTNLQPGASMIRSCMLTDVDGNSVRLGDKMGPGKSVVVFLRHLG